jgi:hypothetical protein
MSLGQVLDTVRACLVDPTVGLTARMTAIAPIQAKIGPEFIRTDFNFVKWRLSAPPALQPSTSPNVMTRPVQSIVHDTMGNLRDATHTLEVSVEFFDAETDVIEANAETAMAALTLLFSGLVAYSLAHGGTIVEVLSPWAFRYGDFANPAGAGDPVSAGITATVSIQERSTQ